jgi:hypothetical protein
MPHEYLKILYKNAKNAEKNAFSLGILCGKHRSKTPKMWKSNAYFPKNVDNCPKKGQNKRFFLLFVEKSQNGVKISQNLSNNV